MQDFYLIAENLISDLRRYGISGRTTLNGTHGSLKVALDSFWPGGGRRHDLVLYLGSDEYWLSILQSDDVYSLVEGTIICNDKEYDDTAKVLKTLKKHLPNILHYETYLNGRLKYQSSIRSNR